MRTSIYSCLLAFAALGAVIITAGCDGSVDKASFDTLKKQSDDNKKIIKDLNAQAVLLDSQVKDMQKKLDTMQKDFDKVSADVANMTTNGGGTGAGNRALEQRINALESRLQRVSAPAGERPAATAEPSEAPAASDARPAAERSRPATTFYTIKQGETLDSIAARHGISPEQIRSLNNIPAGRNVPPGQRIRIPR